MKTTIPFQGFYESIHMACIEDVEEHLFTSYADDTNYEELKNHFSSACRYSVVFEKYAEFFTESFAKKFDIAIKFNSLTSPREYNFRTDQIHIDVAYSEIYRIRKSVTDAQLQSVARRELTSRPGFMSFYDPEIETFGPLKTWDSARLSILIMAYIENHGNFDDYYESALAEDLSGSGYLDNWLCESCPITGRLYRIFNYLEQRAER